MGYARDVLSSEAYAPDTGDGWTLDLRVYRDTEAFEPGLHPVVLVPGYGMNCHPLTYHPSGPSLTEHLAREGFEVWCANLRGQGRSARAGGPRRYGLAELSLTDLPATFDTVLAHTRTVTGQLIPAGCSLGGSVVYAYLAHHRAEHPLAGLVAIGAPLRWDRVHPLVRLVFGAPRLVGRVPMRGTRHLARVAMPLVRRFPKVASVYLNAEIIDLDAADELVKTVEDPSPTLNREIAEWVRRRDLVVEGRDVGRALTGLDLPVLCVLASADGIVPPEAALSIRSLARPGTVEVLEVGDDETWFAHADLFVSRPARERVFVPIARWLRDVSTE